jgi:HEAT repeat protein
MVMVRFARVVWGHAIYVVFALGFFALDVAGQPTDDSALAELGRVLADAESFKVRATAAVALGRTNRVEAVPLLTKSVVKDPHYAVRAAAASALGHIDVTECIPGLLQALTDKDDFVRDEARGALRRFHSEPHMRAFEAVAAAPEMQVRLAAVAALGDVLRDGNGSAAVYVVNGLGDDAPEVRLEAQLALDRVDHERALPILHAGLANGSTEVRAGSARLLARRTDPRSVAPLVTALSQLGEQEMVRIEIRAALKQHAQFIDLATTRQRGQSGTDVTLRQEALRLLGAISDPAGLETLTLALTDASPIIRASAARALGDFGGSKAKAAVLAAAAVEQDPRVKRHLELVLRTMR